MIELFASGATASLELKNYISRLKSYRAQIWNSSYLPPNLLLEPILKPIWVCSTWQVCLWQLSFCLFISEPVEKIQGLNLGLKLITPKSITRTNYNTKISWFGLAGSAMVAILDFLMFISQQAKIWNFCKIPPNIFGTFLEPCWPSWIFLKGYISALGRAI